jgi:hypothetical protein
MALWSVLQPFGLFYGHWYILWVFGIFYGYLVDFFPFRHQEKFGNPV